jgi:hypothetical protein
VYQDWPQPCCAAYLHNLGANSYVPTSSRLNIPPRCSLLFYAYVHAAPDFPFAKFLAYQTCYAMEALSLAANIISVVHVTSEIIDRLNDFKNTVDGIPRTLQAISNELPTLKLTLKKVAEAIEDGRVTEDSEEALRPLLADFEEQIRAIGDIVDKMRSKDPSRIARNFKAVTSFRYDDQIKYHESVIRGYASTLSLERVVSGPGKDLAGMRFLVPLLWLGLAGCDGF